MFYFSNIMNKNTKSALSSPIMGRVIQLTKYIFNIKHLPQKDVQRYFVSPLLTNCHILFIQAMRQLRGKDYVKRATETIEEMVAQAYMIHQLGGFTTKHVAVIDSYCDLILEQLNKINNARIVKSKDESK